jgi:hypothetical protein
MRVLLQFLSCMTNFTRDSLPFTKTVTPCLKTKIRSEKHAIKQLRHCANVIQYTYTNLDSTVIWYSLLLLGYKPAQHVTVLNTVGSCNTMVCIIL